jgi:hypothetical protein
MLKSNLIILLILSGVLFTELKAFSSKTDAKWIYVPETERNDPGLYLFRKTFALDSVPERFEVNVSADNRYKLYINEQLVSVGPVIGDIRNWNYNTVDLKPYLITGKNLISAKVWNEGDLKPVFQFSFCTAFWLQGTSVETEILNTNETWKCIEDKSYTPTVQQVPIYYAAGAGEYIDMRKRVKDWNNTELNDNNWHNAKFLELAAETGWGIDIREGWILQPSIIPEMELSIHRLETTRKVEGTIVPPQFPKERNRVKIAANSNAKILLDQLELTNAYLSMIFSGGINSTIVLSYAEALYEKDSAKNNRNEVEGKIVIGRRDTIISNGGKNQEFTTLSYRTYRYIQIEIKTQDEPLIIEDVFGTFTGYPFGLESKLNTENELLDKIVQIGWRTARLCATETYMDCPYYERLQYIGDTRIQMMISYFNSGDDRLAKYALNLFDQSRTPDGYTYSRYPDTQGQLILPYSLWYVCTLEDYLMYGKDKTFLQTKLLGTRQILNYFITKIAEDGSLKNIPGWNYTDWVPAWYGGIGPMGEDGSSALIDLQLLLALQSGYNLERAAGLPVYATLYHETASKLISTIKEKYWDESRKLFADSPSKNKFSQQANSLAILAGLTNGENAREIALKMLSDTTLAQASIYFKYYLHQALTEAGMGDDYLNWLDIWYKNIELGMTTWGETSEVETTRSDCHAWGSSPNIEFYRIVLGIQSSAPYFEKVRIEPHLGSIKQIGGEIPHPAGKIVVNYFNSGEGIKAEIDLPVNITGTFVWKGRIHELHPGRNNIEL